MADPVAPSAPASASSGAEIRVRRPLISVSDKTGIVDFARGLSGLGVEIVSTGGTAQELEHAGIEVRSIGEFAGFPEIMEGGVKTRHRHLYAGMAARRGGPSPLLAAEAPGAEFVQLV